MKNLIGVQLKRNDIYKYLNLYKDLYGDHIYLTPKSKKYFTNYVFINEIVINDIYLSDNSNILKKYKDLIKNYLDIPFDKIRNNLILGMGNHNADIVFVSENILNEEELNRLLFVGKTGELLDKILSSINLSRKDIYICNIFRNKSINNNLLYQEVDNCELCLIENLKNIRPKVIVSLGRIDTMKIFRTKENLNKMRKKILNYNNMDLLVTYHPNKLLRNLDLKKNAWEDFQLIRDKYINA